MFVFMIWFVLFYCFIPFYSHCWHRRSQERSDIEQTGGHRNLNRGEPWNWIWWTIKKQTRQAITTMQVQMMQGPRQAVQLDSILLEESHFLNVRGLIPSVSRGTQGMEEGGLQEWGRRKWGIEIYVLEFKFKIGRLFFCEILESCFLLNIQHPHKNWPRKIDGSEYK